MFSKHNVAGILSGLTKQVQALAAAEKYHQEWSVKLLRVSEQAAIDSRVHAGEAQHAAEVARNFRALIGPAA